MFYLVGILSVISIVLGLFFREQFSDDFANFLLFGGVIIGSLNVLFHFVKGLLNK